MVGGILVDHYGYHVTFLVTASMHTMSVLVRTPLLLLVPSDAELSNDESEDDSGRKRESEYESLAGGQYAEAETSRREVTTDAASPREGGREPLLG